MFYFLCSVSGRPVPGVPGGGGYASNGLKKLPHSGSSDEDPYSLTPSGICSIIIRDIIGWVRLVYNNNVK